MKKLNREKDSRVLKHKIDASHAELLKDIVKHPLDLPSLERQVFWCEDEPFLSDGYQWEDKPHRVLAMAIDEIRALRAYIVENHSISLANKRIEC